MVTRLYIIRHGETEGNVTGVFQGHTDGILTEKGEKQLEKLAERCKELHFDIIYCSPLTRTVKTAEAVNKYHGVPIIHHKNLIEIFAGDMEGHTWEEIQKLFPEISRIWIEKFSHFSAPNGESVAGVYKRVSEALIEIAEANKGKSIGIISHGGAIFLMLAFLGGYTLDNLDECKYWCQNTGICCIDFDDSLNPEIIFYNDINHIASDPDTMPGKIFNS